MKRLTLLMFVVLIGVTFLFVGTITTVEAKPDEDPQDPASIFEPWSNNGVSQYAAGLLNQDSYPLKLYNPNNKTHAVAAIAYNRVQLDAGEPEDAEDAEEFLDCFVLSLSPHAAVSISEYDLGDDRGYVEVISVPRYGYYPYFNNDYGINGQPGEPGGSLVLLDPKFFTAPSEAKSCVCDKLEDLNLG